MTCCLNPHCPQKNPECLDGIKFCTSCGTELTLLSNRYRPINRLGEGGFGITYLAVDIDMFMERCVIKQLTLQIPDAQRLFEDEARRLKELDNLSSIPRLLAYPSDANYLYLVQEFVEGQDLYKELQQNGMRDEKYVRDFLNEILLILDQVHARIIHRDIKLDNIMRRSDKQLLLIDFGVAKVIPVNNTPQPGTRAGTDGYAAPEQMKEGLATKASDLYSVGAACFYLLTNVSPAHVFMEYGYQWPNKWRQYLKQPVSKELRDVIDKLLKYEHGERFQDAKEVIEALKTKSLTPVGGNYTAFNLPYIVIFGIAITVGATILLQQTISNNHKERDHTKPDLVVSSPRDIPSINKFNEAKIQVKGKVQQPSMNSKTIAPIPTFVQKIGWIRIGSVATKNGQISIGQKLISTTQPVTISPSQVPSIGDQVTVINGVNIRTDSPKPPYYTLPTQIAVVPPGQKLVIINTHAFVDLSSLSPYTIVWAEVGIHSSR